MSFLNNQVSFKKIIIKLWNNGPYLNEYKEIHRDFTGYNRMNSNFSIMKGFIYDFNASTVWGAHPPGPFTQPSGPIVPFKQTAQFIIDYGNRTQKLICPINGTSKFRMNFADALK
jgi:hypothetical protein